MGAKASKSLTNTSTFITDIVLSTVVTSNTNCTTTGTISQNQDVSVDGTAYTQLMAPVLQTCLAAGQKPADCAALVQGVQLNGVNQGADITITTTCVVNNDVVNQVQANLENQINQKLASTSDDIGDALKGIVSALNPKGSSSTSLSNSAVVKNTIASTFTVDAVQSMVTSFAAQQSQAISIKNQPGVYANFNQNLKLRVMSDLVAKNSTLSSAVATVDNSSKSDLTNKEQGPVDIFQSFFGFLKSSMGITAVVLCCLLCVVMVVLAIFFATGGQETLQKGINQVGKSRKPF